MHRDFFWGPRKVREIRQKRHSWLRYLSEAVEKQSHAWNDIMKELLTGKWGKWGATPCVRSFWSLRSINKSRGMKHSLICLLGRRIPHSRNRRSRCISSAKQTVLSDLICFLRSFDCAAEIGNSDSHKSSTDFDQFKCTRLKVLWLWLIYLYPFNFLDQNRNINSSPLSLFILKWLFHKLQNKIFKQWWVLHFCNLLSLVASIVLVMNLKINWYNYVNFQ